MALDSVNSVDDYVAKDKWSSTRQESSLSVLADRVDRREIVATSSGRWTDHPPVRCDWKTSHSAPKTVVPGLRHTPARANSARR